MTRDIQVWLLAIGFVAFFGTLLFGGMAIIYRKKNGVWLPVRKPRYKDDPKSGILLPVHETESEFPETLLGYPIRFVDTPDYISNAFLLPPELFQGMKQEDESISGEEDSISFPETQRNDEMLTVWENALDEINGLPKKHPILDMDIDHRKHVLLVGATGDGKTQAQIAMMIKDIKRSVEVFWMNPDLALFNDEDQPTDLRPIRDRFHQVFEYDDILKHLQAFVQVINDRKPRYRKNEPVGHTIVAYLDEWPSIVQVHGDEAVQALQVIAREGRKVKVFLCVASQDALVDTMGVKSGVIQQFNTRLAASADRFSWSALMGKGVPVITPERQGDWSWCEKIGKPIIQVHITPATSSEIQSILSTGKLSFPALPEIDEVAVLSSIEDDLVRTMLDNDPSVSDRAIARALWPHSRDGGGRYAQEAKKVRDRVLLLRVTEPQESGVFRTGNSVIPVTEAVTPIVTPSVTPNVTPVTEAVTPSVTAEKGGN